jgi:hypothetical protein
MKVRNAFWIGLLGAGLASAQTATPETAPAESKPAGPVAQPSRVAKRDPFLSPIVRAESVQGVPCEGAGKKCLAPNQVVLRGVVRTPDGMIAVVEATARKISYFLRENDPVFNGYVVRITSDSVVFRESAVDNMGRQTTRDVIKRVTAPSV